MPRSEEASELETRASGDGACPRQNAEAMHRRRCHSLQAASKACCSSILTTGKPIVLQLQPSSRDDARPAIEASPGYNYRVMPIPLHWCTALSRPALSLPYCVSVASLPPVNPFSLSVNWSAPTASAVSITSQSHQHPSRALSSDSLSHAQRRMRPPSSSCCSRSHPPLPGRTSRHPAEKGGGSPHPPRDPRT